MFTLYESWVNNIYSFNQQGKQALYQGFRLAMLVQWSAYDTIYDIYFFNFHKLHWCT